MKMYPDDDYIGAAEETESGTLGENERQIVVSPMDGIDEGTGKKLVFAGIAVLLLFLLLKKK